MRAGVSGMSRCVIPNGPSASTTALTTAGGMAMHPHSPGVAPPRAPLEGDPPGLALDPPRADARPEGPALRLGREVRGRLEPGGPAGGQPVAPRIRRARPLPPRHAALGHAGHLEAAG